MYIKFFAFNRDLQMGKVNDSTHELQDSSFHGHQVCKQYHGTCSIEISIPLTCIFPCTVRAGNEIWKPGIMGVGKLPK